MSLVDQIEAMLESGLTIEQALATARTIERKALAAAEALAAAPKTKKPSAPREPSEKDQVLAALGAVLSPTQAQAVVAHRAKIKAPLTVHGASLLASKFGKAPSPDHAADTMISNGWRGFELAWLNNGRGSAPQARQATFADLAHRFNDELEADRYEPGR